jgi:hypothetical protein
MTMKEDLAFFREEHSAEDFFKIQGYQTGAEKFKVLLQEGFLEKGEKGYLLTEMGRNQLMKPTKEEAYVKLKLILEKTKGILRKKHKFQDRKANVSNNSQRVALNRGLSELNSAGHLLIEEFNKISSNIQFKKYSDSLHSLEIEITSQIFAIEKNMPKKLENITKIEPIRERIISLNFDNITEKNLLSGLKSIESQDFLGSFLISGRIIVHFINKIRGETKKEKLESLEKEDEIRTSKEDKDRADKKMFDKLLEEHMPQKKYRDFASHQVTYFPDMEESMRELSHAIEIAKRVKDLKENFD